MGQLARMRNLANVVNLSTPLGIALAALGRGRLRRVGTLIVADSARLPFLNASAMTVGSVVLIPGRTLEEVQTILPDLVGHEEEHAWQWAVCLGLPFIPLYFAAAGWSLLRCGDRASANLFERQAGLRRGGYPERPKRPLATLFTRAGGK